MKLLTAWGRQDKNTTRHEIHRAAIRVVVQCFKEINLKGIFKISVNFGTGGINFSARESLDLEL